MKKIILTFSTFLFLMFINTSLIAQEVRGKSLIGLANAAASSCIEEYRAKGFEIRPVVETTRICFVSGFAHKVTFYAVGRCKTNPCPRPFPLYVASVYFDCSDNVIATECAK